MRAPRCRAWWPTPRAPRPTRRVRGSPDPAAGRMRVGVFGGTFDPPHVGHLLVASDACEALALDRMVLVPAGTQPLKAGAISAPADARLAMTRLLADGDPRFEVDPIEI